MSKRPFSNFPLVSRSRRPVVRLGFEEDASPPRPKPPSLLRLLFAKPRRSLKQTVFYAVADALLITAIFGASFAVSDHFSPDLEFDPAPPSAPQAPPSVIAQPPPVPLALKRHRAVCWTKSQDPKADLPSAAVVSTFGPDRTFYTTDPDLVDLAFDEALGTPTDGLDVVALCI